MFTFPGLILPLQGPKPDMEAVPERRTNATLQQRDKGRTYFKGRSETKPVIKHWMRKMILQMQSLGNINNCVRSNLQTRFCFPFWSQPSCLMSNVGHVKDRNRMAWGVNASNAFGGWSIESRNKTQNGAVVLANTNWDDSTEFPWTRRLPILIYLKNSCATLKIFCVSAASRGV